MLKLLDRYFGLKESGSNVRTELMAGLTTFLTMAYIVFVNPHILSQAGMDKGAVFTATIIAAAVGTLIMGLVANVPFAQAPGMGLNAFFTFTVVMMMGLKWQEALAVVFLCGMINIIVTVTRVRKMLIESIPEHLQYAISGGIGLFIAYIGMKNAHFLDFLSDGANAVSKPLIIDGNFINIVTRDVVPSLVNFKDPVSITALIGLFVTVILLLLKVRGSILLGILTATIAGIFLGVTRLPQITPQSFLPPSLEPTLFKLDFASLFGNPARFFEIFAVILAFSLADTFDTIGTFLGTGRHTGIFDKADEEALHNKGGMKSKLDRALFADAAATSIGAVLGTSNVTTYVESASGISAGGRTGLTSVFTALFFILALFLSPLAIIIPAAATAPALIAVGILMMESIRKVKWDDFDTAASAFFTAVFMPFTYSITNGIAAGFLFYIITRLVRGKIKEVHPLMIIVTALFLANFIYNAVR